MIETDDTLSRLLHPVIPPNRDDADTKPNNLFSALAKDSVQTMMLCGLMLSICGFVYAQANRLLEDWTLSAAFALLAFVSCAPFILARPNGRPS